MSEFLNRGRHDGLTAAVQEHFGVKGAAAGANATSTLPAPAKQPPFGRPGTGVNHIDKDWADNRAFTEQFGK